MKCVFLLTFVNGIEKFSILFFRYKNVSTAYRRIRLMVYGIKTSPLGADQHLYTLKIIVHNSLAKSLGQNRNFQCQLMASFLKPL